MGRMSNRERITRAAEEARLAEEEKAAKRPAKKSPRRPSKARAPKDVRMKIVWQVFNSGGKPVQTFAYPDKDAAEKEAQKLSASTGYRHTVRASKVPME